MKHLAKAKRVEIISTGGFFSTSADRNIRDVLSETRKLPDHSWNMFYVLQSLPGMGVSSIFKRIVAENLPIEGGAGDYTSHPVVHIYFPAGSNLLDLCAGIMGRLNLPRLAPIYTNVPTTRTIRSLELAQTKLLLIDDFTSIISLPMSEKTRILNFIKSLQSEANVKVVCAGVPKIWDTIRMDSQLEGRATQIKLHPLSVKDGTMLEYLNKFEAWCPLQNQSNLAQNRNLQTRLMRQTKGITRNLTEKLLRMAVYAVYSDHECIDQEVWEEVFEA